MLQQANKNPLILGRCWSQNLSTNPGDAIPEYHDLLSGALLGGWNVTRWPFKRSKQIASRKQVKRKIGQSSTNRFIFVGICWQNPWRLAIFILKIIPWVFRFCLALDDPVESYEKQCGKSRCWRWKVFFSNKLMRIGNALWILFWVTRFFVGGGFQFYMFIPNPTWGKDFHFDEHIFFKWVETVKQPTTVVFVEHV